MLNNKTVLTEQFEIVVFADRLKVGTAATVAAIAATKTTVLSLTAAGALTVGAVVATSLPDAAAIQSTEKNTQPSHSKSNVRGFF